MAQPKWKHVWITGASSGLGENVARILAARGCHVSITARSQDKLAAIAADFDNVSSYVGDVTDPQRLNAIVDEAEAAHGPIDLTIFCAGAWFPSPITKMKVENFAKTVDVNLMGVVYSLDAVLARMIERGRGHISWVSSVAGYGGLPNSAAYGSTKAALIHLAESVRPELERKGLTLSLINPGFVKTPMTDKNDFPMPFIMEPQDAAEAMVRGLERETFEVTFPKRLAWILKFMNILPYPLYFWITHKMVG